jgi:hypothetical protein
MDIAERAVHAGNVLAHGVGQVVERRTIARRRSSAKFRVPEFYRVNVLSPAFGIHHEDSPSPFWFRFFAFFSHQATSENSLRRTLPCDSSS